MGDAVPGPFMLRKATMVDLDAIAKVVQKGFPDDPEFDYRFPYRDEYPTDNWKWVRREYEDYIGQPEKYAVLVAVACTEPIAVAVWDVAVETKSMGGDGGIHERRDANPAHMREYARALSAGFARFFAPYGTMLCNWGLVEATKKGWILTVLASPMGKILYEHLGYNLVGTEKVQADGEDETFNVYCLEQKTT